MAVERAGQPAQPRTSSTSPTWSRRTTRCEPDLADPGSRSSFGTSGHRGSSLNDRVQRGAHRWRPPRRSASTARRRAPTARCSSARDTHALSEPAWATALEVLAANDVTVLVDSARRATRRHPRSRTRSCGTTGAADDAASRADGIVVTPSHNPPARRRLQVQPAARRPGRHRRHRLDRGPRQRAAARPAARASGGCRCARARAAATTAVRLPRHLRRRPAERPRPRRDPRGRGADRRRPAGRRERRLLGRDRRAAPARPHRGQPARRPHLAVHDARLGRQDPDGLLVAVRDGLADRRNGRFQIATGNDADADRHGIVTPGRRADEPQPLPGRRDRATSTRTGPAGRDDAAIGKTLVSSSMIDRVAGRPRPPAGRGAGRVQVVRARAARRLGRLRRRGVGRRVVPAPRRLGLDDRQGRHPARPAGLGDPGGDRELARASTTRELTERYGEPAYARIDAPADREQKAVLAKLSPDAGHARPSWPASRSRRS